MVREHLEEAKTIETAIENALKKLNATRKEVEVEVVQEPSRGVLGLLGRPAVVRVRLKKPVESRDIPGTISVIDGKLQYTAPQGEGPQPSLLFSRDFKVRYQGKEINHRLILTAGLATLEIELPENSAPKLEYEIKISKNNLKAELFWKRTPGVKYKLAEKSPANQLSLTLEKEFVEPPALTKEEVREIVAVEGLAYGIDLSKITPKQLRQPSGLITIAEGIAPTPHKQPVITYRFQEDTVPDVDFDALRIDHYEVHGIRSVKPGTVLAVKTPGVPGTPGIDVFGKEISIEPMIDPPLQVGEGAYLTQDGLRAVAERDGLPMLQGGVVKVLDAFELAGDADVSTGNITMDGAIIIRGNVLESVKVESKKGNIIVNGLVSGAILRTAGSINVVRNVLRSQLYAGGQTVIKIRQVAMLHNIGNQLEQLLKAHDAIVKQAENIPFENLIKHLLELKFFDLPKDIKAFADYFKEVEASSSLELALLAEKLTNSLLGTGPLEVKDISSLRELHSLLRSQEVILEKETDTDSNATVGYLQNSSIEASGVVEITGTGCYYSKIVAGRGFQMPNGVFRGGEITVNQGDIKAKEFGGPTGVATEAHIVKEGKITANRVYPNVRISIGNQHFRFGEEGSQVKAFIQEGNLSVFSGSLKINE
ncbi:MAG TPA: FapA family protein [Firmicutes bacterium]|nr:FapA family protein [Bacillota bacterium]